GYPAPTWTLQALRPRLIPGYETLAAPALRGESQRTRLLGCTRPDHARLRRRRRDGESAARREQGSKRDGHRGRRDQERQPAKHHDLLLLTAPSLSPARAPIPLASAALESASQGIRANPPSVGPIRRARWTTP